jgi:hypothetical protein
MECLRLHNKPKVHPGYKLTGPKEEEEEEEEEEVPQAGWMDLTHVSAQ